MGRERRTEGEGKVSKGTVGGDSGEADGTLFSDVQQVLVTLP